ncbi:MAG: UvrB/UvrC motif-containing protein [Clostridiales bacterium]|nr:UvrB/UvrC motif-containing protein [Clostridiales bacterium]
MKGLMSTASASLNFERAIQIRDEMIKLRKRLNRR